jgi:excisionase family DNA binding protein
MRDVANRLVIVPPKAHTVAEVAELLRVDRATAYRMIKDGDLRYCTVRSKLLVPADAITEYLQRGVDLASIQSAARPSRRARMSSR